ncbi:hypothetical protein KEM52_001146 [Ascosphaera acerosa]|nr:hypothetical protein KEM52_001146 [Ascosphaera acerosa]
MSLPTASIAPSQTGVSQILVESINDLPRAQVDAIIRTKRKAREPKACYPCHTRKVKCDRKLPCDGCVKRDHADLCTYERPAKKRQIIATADLKQLSARSMSDGHATPVSIEGHADDKEVTLPRHAWDQVCSRLREMEQTIAGLRDGMEHVTPIRQIPSVAPSTGTAGSEDSFSPSYSKGEGTYATNEYGDNAVHLGSRSVLAHILGHPGVSQETANALLEGGILPKLGLDNESATYPFIDLWSSSDPAIFDLDAVCAVLPDDESCRRYVSFYCEVTSALYPVLPDMDQFIENVELLLRTRNAWSYDAPTAGTYSEKPYGMDIDFMGLVFAVLAAGCLGSDQPGKSLTSQVYVCCSYQCLRAQNYMSQPTLEAIETMLIIGSVLSYNMNPGVSYVILGMTIRLTLVTGLQADSHRFPPKERLKRQSVWWSMAWQDSHFSLSYDRPSSMAFSQPPIPYAPDSKPGHRSYFESLCRLISVTLSVVRARMISPHSHMDFAMIKQYHDEIRSIFLDGLPHLRDRTLCATPVQHLERLALKLHSSFISSELCRASLRPHTKFSEAESKSLRHDCINALTRTVEAYIELHNISPSASVSWTALQRAISSAFLLVVLGEARAHGPARDLLRQLETVLAQKAAREDNATEPELSIGTAASSPETFRMLNPTMDASMPCATAGFDPYWLASSGGPLPVPPPQQAQWTTPLTKTLRTLHKLNAALAKQDGQRYTEEGEASSCKTQVLRPDMSCSLQSSGLPSVTESAMALP